MVRMRALCGMLAVSLSASALGAVNVTTVGRVSSSPLVDGKRDASYGESMPIAGFTFAERMDLSYYGTELRLVHDGERLYGYASCRQENPLKMKLSAPIRQDPNVWRGDSLELFFVSEKGLRYYAIGPSGSVNWIAADEDEANKWIHRRDPESDIRLAVTRDEQAWHVEFSIPFAEIGREGWRFNAIRNKGREKPFCWQQQDNEDWWAPASSEGRGRLRVSEEPLGGLAFAALPSFDRKKPFSYAVTNAANEIVYRYEYAIPRPYVKIWPANVRGDALLLNGNRGIEAFVSWAMKHNYPNMERPLGWSVKMPVVIRFTVPEGVTVTGKNVKRTGSAVCDGRTCGVYEQHEQRAYNAPHWISTKFTSTLKHGTEGVIRYRLLFKDGEQPETKLPFRVIDVPEVTLPKRFITAHEGALYSTDFEEAERWMSYGVNSFASRGYGEKEAAYCRALIAKGCRVYRGDNFWPGECKANGRWMRWTDEDETARALDIDGKAINIGDGYQLSPSYRGRLLDEAVAKEADFCRRSGARLMIFDMEDYFQRRGEFGDFRPETVAAFRANWKKAHPEAPVPDPFAFMRNPTNHPAAFKVWVDTKCELWGDFMATMKRKLESAIGEKVLFSEWSWNRFDTLEGRNHSLRGAGFFRAFDYISLDTYCGIDRGLRQIRRSRAAYRRTFPGERELDLIITPSPYRLGKDDKANYYYTTAPSVKDETICLFKEAMTMGAKGIYTFMKAYIDMDYQRQFATGVNLVSKVEDIVMDGMSFELSCDFPADAKVQDNFNGKPALWENEPRVFTRGITLKGRTLISVSEYREQKDIVVQVNYSPKHDAVAVDLETGEKIGTFVPQDKSIPVRLEGDRRCRIILMCEK